jgi:hypothetical protein
LKPLYALPNSFASFIGVFLFVGIRQEKFMQFLSGAARGVFNFFFFGGGIARKSTAISRGATFPESFPAAISSTNS